MLTMLFKNSRHAITSKICRNVFNLLIKIGFILWVFKYLSCLNIPKNIQMSLSKTKKINSMVKYG